MVGIRAIGAYVPKHRLTKETAGWGTPGERAVASFDEDSVTMATAAAIDCLHGIDRRSIDGILFATTSNPYFEKQSASTIATALDFQSAIFSEDLASTLRSGTSGLRAAADAVRAGSAKNVLLTAADIRLAYPKSDMERYLGDGGAALLISDTDVAVEIEAAHFITEHMVDLWRSTTDAYIRSGEDRFIADEGYLPAVIEAATGLAKKTKLTPKDFAKAAIYASDPRRHGEIARRLGLAPQQLQDPMFGALGNTGTAFPLMMLVAALEDAKPGDRILLIGYGDGADAYALKVTDKIEQARAGRRLMKKHLASKAKLPSYETFLRWRGLLAAEPARRPDPQPVSLQAAWRDTDRNLRLYGGKCKACGHTQYPPQKQCAFCKAYESWSPVRLSDKQARIATFSMDYVAGTQDVPLVITVVDFDGGGRALLMMTDREIDQVKVGMPVEMTFRKLGVIGGVHNYYWKSSPIRA
jgi:3-hydroxy-3-methylglutaryl CoA synthase